MSATSAKVRSPRARRIAAPDAAPGRSMAPELSATILAVSAVIVGGVAGLPSYGIFLGWAAASLAQRAGIRSGVLVRCLVAGGALGTVCLLGTSALGVLFGAGAPAWVSAAVALVIVNPLLILLGRSARFAAVPAMFIGFSSLLAIHLGSTLPLTDSVLGALLVALATNLAGIGVNWLGARMSPGTKPRAAPPGAARPDSRLRE